MSESSQKGLWIYHYCDEVNWNYAAASLTSAHVWFRKG